MQNNKAFTLIELLVVVLIIGILAAVALPQYQQAVNKSRFVNLSTLAKSFVDATKVYHLTTGEYPRDIEALSIDYPVEMALLSIPDHEGTCVQNDDIYCCIAKSDSSLRDSVVCGRRDYSFAFEYNHTGNLADIPMCLAKSDNTNAVKMCQSFGPSLGTYGLITPDGIKLSYKFYRALL